MKNLLLIAVCVLCLTSCRKTVEQEKADGVGEETTYPKPKLNQSSASYLYHFAYDCIDQEYPNRLGQTLGDASFLKEPSELHPAFYGCYDWHSSVHGHWTLLNIIKEFPDFEHREAILKKLQTTITKENIAVELAYFEGKFNKTFERTYGWAWMLKLAETLRDWDNDEANEMYQNLEPLVTLIEKRFVEFLPKLTYPIRVGEHPNTAFGMSLALDYARKYSPQLEQFIVSRAKEYYLNDVGCPITWEPGGFDFLSPCLQEASLMMKVLPKNEFELWLTNFLPGFKEDPSSYIDVVEVSDRSDGKLAHLDGLNFSRAWCLYEIGNTLNNDKMVNLANKHYHYSYSKMDSGEYAGAHWLATFALYAVLKSN